LSLTIVEVRCGEWWTNGSATVLVGGFYVEFQSLGSILMKIFFAWYELERVNIVAVFVAGAFGS